MDVAERDALVSSIVARVADYREGEIPRITPASVLAWWEQFDEGDRPSVLRETDRLLRTTYVSREKMRAAVTQLATSTKLAGADPAAFWRSVGFLRIQQKGVSQVHVLAQLNGVLAEKFGGSAEAEASATNTYVYLDDVSCTCNRIRYDLERWLNDSDIRNAHVHVISLVAYSSGLRYARRKLCPLLRERGCTIQFWAKKTLENRLEHVADAEVYWPTHLPDDEHVTAWSATFGTQPHFTPRPPGGRASDTLFSSEAAREAVEQAFLRKGAYIYSLPNSPNASMRPLGFSALRTPGFGTTVITARNCPNNAPLVLWWGDPNGGEPLSRWRPLLPRRVGADNQGADDYGF